MRKPKLDNKQHYKLYGLMLIATLTLLLAAYFSWQKQRIVKASIVAQAKLDGNRQTSLKPYQQQFIQDVKDNEAVVNQSILNQRYKIIALMKQAQRKPDSLTQAQQNWLDQTAKEYKLPQRQRFAQTDSVTLNRAFIELLKRVDIVPNALVTAQAINESNWGRSRFAQQGNNYFGMRCHTPGCGIIAKGRPANSRWEVTRYPSMLDSIRAYVHTLNTLHSYEQLRILRAELRLTGASLNSLQTSLKLAEGLLAYSIKGEDYVQSIQVIIGKNM